MTDVHVRQLAFDLGQSPQFGPDNFLVSSCNERAFALIEAWPNWSTRALLLIGPPGSGKSHLAAIFAARAQAAIVPAVMLPQINLVDLVTREAIVVEDADQIGRDGERDLFHLFNLTQEANVFMLLTGGGAPETWGLRTADLISRLRLCPTVELCAPDEELLAAVIVKLFLDRQLIVDAEIVGLIALHIDRSFDAARRFVARLDREALARRAPITKSLVRTMLNAFRGEVQNHEHG